jgi:dihydroorotate dehydrogenase (fumarate)
MNAAGTCKTVEDVAELARSAASAVVVGSVTERARAGNSGTVYYTGPCYSLNALGLPNRGLTYYREHLPAMADLVHAAGKPLIVSIAGFNAAEYATVAHEVARCGVDLIELNLACPNVWDGGTQKRIACFDTGQTETICGRVGDALAAASAGGTGRSPRSGPPYGVKISPFSDPTALADLAALIGRLSTGPGGPRYVCAVNTLPNAFAVDGANRPVIDIELAGLGGAALKPVALGQVRQLRRLLPERVEIVGVGGVAAGRDVADFLHAGASAVQVATAFFNRDGNPGIFGEILAGWAEHLDEATL